MAEAKSLIGGLADNERFDVAVLGSGAAGMSAALTAASQGNRVILIERTEYLGGTSAFSAATIWVPNTHLGKQFNPDDTYDNALRFLDNAVGNHAPRNMREAFLKAGPAAIKYLEDKSILKLRARDFHPDYLSELEGSTSCGRALEPESFDGQKLGDDLDLVRPAIPEFTILGGLMVDRQDIPHLLAMKKSLKSAVYSAKLIGRYYLDRLRLGRSPRLLMGRALIGQMLHAARRQGVAIATKAEVTDFTLENGKIVGLTVEQNGVKRKIRVDGGVILASGGFARNPALRESYLPKPTPDYSPSAPGHTGKLHELALALGARHGEGALQNAFWAPVSVRLRKDGSTAVFPHFVFDRGKPGMISVGRDGKRFVNENTSYHLFGKAMFETNKDGSTIPAFMIGDANAMQKYGMGMVRPGHIGLRAAIRDGYVIEGSTLAELAAKCGIDAAGLEATAVAMNGYAQTGKDLEFNRGVTVYERANGDASNKPNPCLGSISTGPFYALKLYPGDIGSAMGLVTDERARVLDRENRPIEGLYAVGADMHSIMGGTYPGPGITIGPGLVFGYIAAMDASARKSISQQAA